MSANNHANRFSGRAENYVKYRPGYPAEIIPYLTEMGILKATSIIADIGSGTGLSAELFLKNGNILCGVEPNNEMRQAGEKYLWDYNNYLSVNGSAENTTLKSGSFDLILCAQAFHWFDIRKTKTEFKRILKPGGCVVLLWNERITGKTGFLQEYENLLLKFGTDYSEVRHDNTDDSVLTEFFENGYTLKTFPNFQIFDFEGLKGRLLSSSYAPVESHPDFIPMITELDRIFNLYNVNGYIKFEYTSKLYYSKL